MEVEEIQRQQPCKFARVGNGNRNDTTTTKTSYPDDEEEVRHEPKRPNHGGDSSGGVTATNRLRGWHHSSRIIRVSRASGGKDRHSKVWTSKGPRDRRVRLSVNTAIQFYDLQDRLGYDQPSKAVEWLIKAAAEAIAELPSLNSSFPNTPQQLSDEKRGSDGGGEQGFDSADVELLQDPNFNNRNQCQHLSLSKSACSSTSETSKGSGLSLSRSDVRVNRVRARERARERAAREKEKENESRIAHHHHQNINPISQNSTFTELLTGGISSNNNSTTNAAAVTTSPGGSDANFFQKAAAARQWPLALPMDYFSTGFWGPSSSSRTTHQSSGYAAQIQLGNSIPPHAMTMSMIPPFNVTAPENHHQQEQHFPFVSDHLMPPVAATTQPGSGGDYNLNFTISSSSTSSGLAAGFNTRGTLQSNSSSSPSLLLSQFQRYTSSIDGSANVPFYIGATTQPAPPPPVMENHHHHHQQFPSGLQLCYGDASRHSSDHKGKGKN